MQLGKTGRTSIGTDAAVVRQAINTVRSVLAL